MKKKEFEEVEAVVSICGDYCAWHETSIRIQYLFGDFPIDLDMISTLENSEEIEFDYEEFKNSKKNSKKHLDKKVQKFIDNYDGDYCDYEIQTILVKFKDGSIIQKYICV